MALDVQRFREELVYRSRTPVPEVMKDLATLGRFDQDTEARRRTLFIAAWVLMLLGLGAFVVAVPLLVEEETGAAGLGGLGAGVGLIGLSIWCFVRRDSTKRFDLENRRYGLLASLLHRLRTDLDPDAPVSVTLDLEAADATSKLQGSAEKRGWVTEEYLDPWLAVEARLADGTHLRLRMVERLRKLSRTKQSASGRMKTKTKRKGFTLAEVLLRVKPERHPQLAGLAARAKRAVRLAPGVTLARLRVTEDRLLLRARIPLDWYVAKPGEKDEGRTDRPDASRAVTMVLLSLYQVLNYSTALRKRAEARATP